MSAYSRSSVAAAGFVGDLGPQFVGQIALLSLMGLWIPSMAVRVFAIGLPEALAWSALYAATLLIAANWPLAALAGLAFSCTTLPYLEPVFSVGKQLPVLVTTAVAVGSVLGLTWRGSWRAEVRQRRAAVPAALFGNLIVVSATIATLRYSPMASSWFEGTPLEGFSLAALAGPEATTSRFLTQAAIFVSGPVLALAVIALVASRAEARTAGDVAYRILGGTLGGLALSLLVCLGQALVPGFPLASREPRWPSGLLTNPGPLSTIVAIAFPVAIAIALQSSAPRWLRGLAAANLVLAVGALGPMGSKTGQVGVVVGALALGGLLLLGVMRGTPRRKLLVGVALTVVGGLVLVLAVQGLVLASVSDWSAFADESSFGFRGGRLERNRQMLLMFRDHPLAGTGVGTFTLLLPGNYARYGTVYSEPMVLPPTNHFLHLAATGGAFILGVTVWMLLSFSAPALRRVVSGEGAERRLLEAGLMAAILTFVFLSNWQGETWYRPYVASVFWLLVGLSAGLAAGTGRTVTAAPWRSGPWPGYALVAAYALFSCLGL